MSAQQLRLSKRACLALQKAGGACQKKQLDAQKTEIMEFLEENPEQVEMVLLALRRGLISKLLAIDHREPMPPGTSRYSGLTNKLMKQAVQHVCPGITADTMTKILKKGSY
eukprot:7114952-Lingulodinium_polyedra.AAC.1